jgi:hypothetical protein
MRLQLHLFLLLFTAPVYGLDSDSVILGNQEKKKTKERPTRFLNLGIFPVTLTVKDKGMSPLLYTGYGGNFSLGYQREKIFNRTGYFMDFGYGLLSPDFFDGIRARNYRLNFDVYHQKYVTWIYSGNYKLFAGGSVNTNTAVRDLFYFSNNSVNYEHFTSLSLSGSIRSSNRFIFTRPMDFHYQVNIPVVNFIVRPSYAFSLPTGFFNRENSILKGFWDSGHIESFNNFIRFENSITTTIHLRNKNAFKVGYGWEFYRYNRIPDNRVSVGVHQLKIIKLFHL